MLPGTKVRAAGVYKKSKHALEWSFYTKKTTQKRFLGVFECLRSWGKREILKNWTKSHTKNPSGRQKMAQNRCGRAISAYRWTREPRKSKKYDQNWRSPITERPESTSVPRFSWNLWLLTSSFCCWAQFKSLLAYPVTLRPILEHFSLVPCFFTTLRPNLKIFVLVLLLFAALSFNQKCFWHIPCLFTALRPISKRFSLFPRPPEWSVSKFWTSGVEKLEPYPQKSSKINFLSLWITFAEKFGRGPIGGQKTHITAPENHLHIWISTGNWRIISH